jgi:hypothetical protein
MTRRNLLLPRVVSDEQGRKEHVESHIGVTIAV